MIDLLIYHIHLVAALYAFTVRWQHEGLRGGGLAIATCALVFTILWAVTGPIARIIMPGGAPGDIFTSDTLSLLLLMIPETFFFRAFFVRGTQGAKRDATSAPSK